MIRVAQFNHLNQELVAKSVYREASHKTSSTGLVVSKAIQEELSSFLLSYLDFLDNPKELFFRIDAFVQENKLVIIEINVELQDGWGVALNLLRAAGLRPDIRCTASMPKQFVDYGDGHRQEFELACRELGLLGHSCQVLGPSVGSFGHQSHAFFSAPTHPTKSEFDSKIYLGRFSQFWQGQFVLTPKMYLAETTPWELVPEDVILKFAKKYGEEAQRARYSVIRREKAGKAKFLRQCYNKGTLIAQESVSPLSLVDGSLVQAVIMCAGSNPVTGYLQIAPAGSFIINDRTAIAGPLVFE